MSTAQIIYLVMVFILTNAVLYGVFKNGATYNLLVDIPLFILTLIALILDTLLIVLSVVLLHTYLWRVLA